MRGDKAVIALQLADGSEVVKRVVLCERLDLSSIGRGAIAARRGETHRNDV
jgi:hypothetical protein